MKRLAKEATIVFLIAVLLFLPTALAEQDQREVKIIKPEDGAVIRGEVEIAAEGIGFVDLNIVGFAVFEYSTDGKNYKLIGIDNKSFDGFGIIWDTTKVVDGDYFIKVMITDLWNNKGSAQILVTIDNKGEILQERLLRVPQQFPTIQEAISNAAPGMLIRVDARQGPYESFVVNVPNLAIKSAYGRALIIAGAEFIVIKANSIEFSGFEVRGGRFGLVLYNVTGCLIKENLITANETGIKLKRANENIIQANTVEGNNIGIVLDYSEGNLLMNNLIRDSLASDIEGGQGGIGLFLMWSKGNRIRDNLLQYNSSGIVLQTSEGNALEGNDLQDHSLSSFSLQGSRSNLLKGNRITGGFSGISLVESSNNTLTGNSVNESSFSGIWLLDSQDNSLENNSVRGIQGPLGGITLSVSSRNSLSGNQVKESFIGITISNVEEISKAGENVLQANTLQGNIIGINLFNTTQNSLVRNTVTANTVGINLIKSSGNLLEGNLIEDNHYFGVFLNQSNQNQIKRNITRDNDVGITLHESNDNMILLNWVIENRIGIGLRGGSSRANIAQENNIVGNKKFGVKNETYVAIDAIENWWGDPSGPYHPTKNPNGKGDKVSDNVDFAPWLKAPVEISG